MQPAKMSAAEERVARVRASLASTLLPISASSTNNPINPTSSSHTNKESVESGDFLAFNDQKKAVPISNTNSNAGSSSSIKRPAGGIASMIAAYGKAKGATEEVEELGARDYLLKHNPSSLLNGASGERRVTELNKTFLKNTIRSVESHNRREQVDSTWRQHKLLKRLDRGLYPDTHGRDEEDPNDSNDEGNETEEGNGENEEEILSFTIDHGSRKSTTTTTNSKPTLVTHTINTANATNNNDNNDYNNDTTAHKRNRSNTSEASDHSDTGSYSSDSDASSGSHTSSSSRYSNTRYTMDRSARTNSTSGYAEVNVVSSSSAAAIDYTAQRALWAERKAQALIGNNIVVSKYNTSSEPEEGEVNETNERNEKKERKSSKEKKAKKDKKEKKDKKDKKEKKDKREKESKHSKHKKHRH